MLNTFLKTQECLITTFEVFQLFFSFAAENNTEKRKKISRITYQDLVTNVCYTQIRICEISNDFQSLPCSV